MTSALAAIAEVAGYDDNGNKIPGQIIFRNALPGTIGNRNGTNMIYGPGSWSLDMTMAKSIEFMEGKRFQFRLDAQNIFNHAEPLFNGTSPTYYGARVTGGANPNAALNDIWTHTYPFGYVNGKTGHRTFQAQLRLSF